MNRFSKVIKERMDDDRTEVFDHKHSLPAYLRAKIFDDDLV